MVTTKNKDKIETCPSQFNKTNKSKLNLKGIAGIAGHYQSLNDNFIVNQDSRKHHLNFNQTQSFQNNKKLISKGAGSIGFSNQGPSTHRQNGGDLTTRCETEEKLLGKYPRSNLGNTSALKSFRQMNESKDERNKTQKIDFAYLSIDKKPSQMMQNGNQGT